MAAPPVLISVAAWSWRVLVIVALLVGLVILLAKLTLAVIPIFAAIFFAALLHRPVTFLRDRHLPRMLATWLMLIVTAIAIGAVGYFAVTRISGHSKDLVSEFGKVVDELKAVVGQIPGGSDLRINDLLDRLVGWVSGHRSLILSGALSAGRVVAEAVTGAALTLFLTYFFLADGDRIWSWIVRLFPRRLQASANGAGYRGWQVVSGWIVGTAVIAVIHATVIGLVLWLLGVPLAVPLAILIFLGSFIPIIGALLFGGLAVLVTLLTGGLVHGLIVLVVLLLENQLEAHLLQPFIVGRAVRLHPVAIVLVLTGGGLLGGVIGAIVAIPIVAACHAAVKYLTGVEGVDGSPRSDLDRMRPIPPAWSAPLPGYGARIEHRPEPKRVADESADADAADSTDSASSGLTDSAEAGDSAEGQETAPLDAGQSP